MQYVMPKAITNLSYTTGVIIIHCVSFPYDCNSKKCGKHTRYSWTCRM